MIAAVGTLTRPAPALSRAKGGRMVVAVTGGAGFIGSHLCRALAARGDEVVCIDNLHTGRFSNLVGAAAGERVRQVEHDIVRPFPDGLPRFDRIYNLACPASPRHYQADPVKTAMVCAMGALNVLERAKADGARVFQASTSEIYGDPEVHPQREDYFGNVNSVGPRSCYDEGKRFAETLFTDYAAQQGLELRMARIFNTYGPAMQAEDGRVVSNFIIQALRGEPITLYGDGQQTRSFCYVDDLIEGFIRLMDLDQDPKGPVNLGNPSEVTVRDLAELVIDMTGSGSKIVFLPLPIDDPRRRRPDIAKAKACLDWTPAVPLRAGLARTIAYFQDEIADPLPVMPLSPAYTDRGAACAS